MGIFDIFTGDPAKEAARRNRALAEDQGAADTRLVNRAADRQMGYLDSGFDNARDALLKGRSQQIEATRRAQRQMRDAYSPLGSLSQKYGQGTDLYMDALGINGPDGNTRATGAFQAGPGYDFMRDEALEAVMRRQAASGMLASGNTQVALQDRASSLADQEYDDWLSRLYGFMSPELQATNAYAGGMADAARFIPNYDMSSLAQLYQNDAASRIGVSDAGLNRRLGVNQNLLGARTGANKAIANAEMGGSANLWNMGLQLGGLGAGAYGGYAGRKAVA